VKPGPARCSATRRLLPNEPRSWLTANELTARELQRARVRYSLEHPPALIVDRELAESFALFDAYFDNVTFAITNQPIVDWNAISTTWPEDPRLDEPARSPEPQRVANRGTRPHSRPRNGSPGIPYVAALLRGAYDDVAHAEPGNRNNELARSAFRYGQVVGAGHLDEASAIAALEEAAQMCGLPQREATSTIRLSLRAGARHPLEK
jgi:hypothetical protein